jgi:hypothetical protein
MPEKNIFKKKGKSAYIAQHFVKMAWALVEIGLAVFIPYCNFTDDLVCCY